MLIISLLLAILIERFFPAPSEIIEVSLGKMLSFVKTKLNSGERVQAIISWFGVTFFMGLVGWLIWLVISLIHPILSLVFSIGVLYLSFGFGTFISRFNTIQKCIKNNQLEEARKHLHDWATFVGSDQVVFETAKSGDISSVSRETIRLAILAAQRNFFGVVFWYIILPGPIGPIIYRVSVQALKSWDSDVEINTVKSEPESLEDVLQSKSYSQNNTDHFCDISVKGFFWIDWVSSRVTAFIFAIVGNFEDAVQMIRARSAVSPKAGFDSERILLSAGEGAMTTRLTVPIATSGSSDFETISSSDFVIPELKEVDENSLSVVVGLVWRSLFLWCIVMLLVTLGYFSNLLS